MGLFRLTPAHLITAEGALPGRAEPVLPHPAPHAVLGTSLTGPWPPGTAVLHLAMGCFWGAEELLWQLPGAVTTSVGYQGGFTANPTYEQACTGLTGHAEVATIAYDPTVLSEYDIFKLFWESHDPTQGYRQGNDVGTQYRSAVYWTTDGQREVAGSTRDAYAAVLAARGYPEISTTIEPAADHVYYLAEDYHQQYLRKNPNGYRCHANTGLALPPPT